MTKGLKRDAIKAIEKRGFLVPWEQETGVIFIMSSTDLLHCQIRLFSHDRFCWKERVLQRRTKSFRIGEGCSGNRSVSILQSVQMQRYVQVRTLFQIYKNEIRPRTVPINLLNKLSNNYIKKYVYNKNLNQNSTFLLFIWDFFRWIVLE